jgi:hypothetical protein
VGIYRRVRRVRELGGAKCESEHGSDYFVNQRLNKFDSVVDDVEDI